MWLLKYAVRIDIISCATLETFIYLCLDWLTCWLYRGLHPIPDHLWVSVLPSSSQTATWTPGNWVCRPFSLWASSRLPDLFRTSWRAKGALKSSLWVTRWQPWTFGTTNLSWCGLSRRRSFAIVCLFHFKRNKYLQLLFTCISCLFWKGNWEVGLDWLAEVPFWLAL